MKLTTILLPLLLYFHGAYAQNNFLNLTIPVGPGEMIVTHPSMCELYFEEYVDYINSEFGEIVPALAFDLPEPLHSICERYNLSGHATGYLGGWGKWCVTTALGQGKAAMLAACAFLCDDMNLNNTNLELPISLEQRNLELPMSLEQRLPDGTDIGVTLDIIDEWTVELLETGGDEVENLLVFEQAMQLYDAFWLMSLEQRLTVTDLSPDEQLAILDEGMVELSKEGRNIEVFDQLMQLYDTFMLSVHACRLHECEDVAQCQRVADMAFEEILESGTIELDIDMDAFDSLEDARELARLLGSRP